ncbi:MAG: hypothetical protein F6K42_21560 [Leptolyngbya sp. SIO1D8]|nr:hypothetical protein [Leptolyngbya sp. SIO1D8]
MHRTILFLSRFFLSLWLVLIISFLALLLFNAPNVPANTPFASASIRTQNNAIIYLPNRIFNCTETAQQFQCQADIQQDVLELSLTKGNNDSYDLQNCEAQYGGQPVSCQNTGETFAPILSKTYEVTALDLSPQQLQAVQRKYQGINTLMQLGEVRLFQISVGLSLVAGIATAFFTWLHPRLFLSKVFASVAAGFGIHQLVLYGLGQVRYDAVNAYGLTPGAWDGVVVSTAIATGIITSLATALLLWQKLNRPTQILVRIMSSVGIFTLCWLSFNYSFIFGLDTFGSFLPLESIVTGLAAAVSVVFAVAAAILLWSHTHQSLKKFMSLGSGFGAVALTSYLLIYLLLGLGYAD